MSQVNKKFNELNKRDEYWEYQFKRDWKKAARKEYFVDFHKLK